MARFRIGIILACGLLWGCADTPAVDIQTVCLPMVTYDKPTSTELATEWTILKTKYPNWVTTKQYIPDAEALRDANKAACSKPTLRGSTQ